MDELLKQLVDKLAQQGVKVRLEVWQGPGAPPMATNAVVLVPVIVSSRLGSDIRDALCKSELGEYTMFLKITYCLDTVKYKRRDFVMNHH